MDQFLALKLRQMEKCIIGIGNSCSGLIRMKLKLSCIPSKVKSFSY